MLSSSRHAARRFVGDVESIHPRPHGRLRSIAIIGAIIAIPAVIAWSASLFGAWSDVFALAVGTPAGVLWWIVIARVSADRERKTPDQRWV